jgi:hypothetical protein
LIVRQDEERRGWSTCAQHLSPFAHQIVDA